MDSAVEAGIDASGDAGPGVFSIGGTNSDELILSDGVLDFEAQASYEVTVRVPGDEGELVRLGLQVDAVDGAPSMLELARQNIADDEVAGQRIRLRCDFLPSGALPRCGPISTSST